MATLLSLSEIDRRMRENPLRLHYFTLEQRFSLWIPLRRSSDNRIFLTGFVFTAPSLPGGAIQVRRPSTQITVDPEDAALVAVIRARYQDFAAGVSSEEIVGVLRPEDIPASTIEELEERRGKLRESYDGMLPLAFAPAAQLSAEEVSQIRLFKRRFDLMMEPCLRPFYKALNPAFFDWLQTITA